MSIVDACLLFAACFAVYRSYHNFAVAILLIGVALEFGVKGESGEYCRINECATVVPAFNTLRNIEENVNDDVAASDIDYESNIHNRDHICRHHCICHKHA